MASVDVRLENAAFYDVTRFDVVKGQEFSISLIDHNGPSDWFSNQDQVLSIEQKGNEATVKAESVGSTRIIIFAPGDVKVKELNIRVVDEIVAPAVTLEIVAGAEEPK